MCLGCLGEFFAEACLGNVWGLRVRLFGSCLGHQWRENRPHKKTNVCILHIAWSPFYAQVLYRGSRSCSKKTITVVIMTRYHDDVKVQLSSSEHESDKPLSWSIPLRLIGPSYNLQKESIGNQFLFMFSTLFVFLGVLVLTADSDSARQTVCTTSCTGLSFLLNTFDSLVLSWLGAMICVWDDIYIYIYTY